MVIAKNIRGWYNNRHHTMGNKSWRPYRAYPVFLDYLQVESGKKLLDIGTGTGYLLKNADQRGLKTYGIDISSEGAILARKNSPNSEIHVGSGEDIKYPDNFFNFVTCIGVLEHFLDIRKGIKEMMRVIVNGGRLCIVVPNKNFILWKLRKNKGTHQKDINEQLFSLKEWSQLFEEAGLLIKKISQDKWKLKGLWLPLKYTYQFIFILDKCKV